MKRTISLLLALVLILGMIPFSAMALEPAVKTETYTHINPLYADVITEADLKPVEASVAAPLAAGDPVYATTFAEAGEQMRQAMVDRERTIVVYYQSADFVSDQHKDIFNAAVVHTGNPDEGDALRWVYAGYDVKINGFSQNGVQYKTLTYYMNYYTTAEQEAELERAMDALLATVDPNGTDYEKFATVYDYICENITYDYDNLYDESYTLKFSAYAALVNGTAVCQGYAVLLYQLALKLGIDCRVITGIGNNGDHGWNIVKFGDVYYNTDSTWDAIWYQARGHYSYYLQNEYNFTDGYTDHIRDAEYDTTEFHALYPISATNFDPNAQPAAPGGACGADLTWELRDGVLTISGTGAMYDYEDAPWAEYRDQINAIVVEDGVTTVGNNAFYECKNVTSVSLPEGLKRIGIAAFAYCEKLENISIPGSVDTIDKSAFCECLNLKKIVIPEGVTQISYEVFRNCQKLASVTIPSTVKIIRDTAFLHCHSLKEVVIPDGVTTIEYGAFMRCYGLESVTIPDSVTCIGTHAFYQCEKLKSVTIPKDITIIDMYTFYQCYDLAEVNLPDGITEIGKYAFYQCDKLEKIDLPQSLTTIGEYALAYSRTWTTVTIPAAVQRIGAYAFAGDTLQTVYFLGDAPVMDEWAFAYQDLTAYYPAGNPTWTEDVMRDYGGIWMWLSMCLGHQWGEWVEASAPTCEENGMMIRTCELCGDYEEELILSTGHNYFMSVVDATCTEQGCTVWTCVNCGDSYSDGYVDALGHSYVDGVCTVCGVGRVHTVTYTSASISLAGDIGVNYYVRLSEGIVADEGAYMQFIVAGQNQIVPLADAVVSTENDGTVTHRFTCKVAAKQMTEEITGQMYLSNGEAVGEAKVYSVKAYCDAAIPIYSQYPAYADLVALMKAMLNYGAYSQTQFSYKTDNLAHAGMDTTLPTITAADVSDYAHGAAGSEAGISVASVSLLLESTTTIRFYFDLEAGRNISDYTFYVDGVEAVPVESNGQYYVEKVNVAAKDLDEMVTVTVGGLTVRYCGLSYVRQVAVLYPAYYSEALINVAKALYAYNQAANAYFA